MVCHLWSKLKFSVTLIGPYVLRAFWWTCHLLAHLLSPLPPPLPTFVTFATSFPHLCHFLSHLSPPLVTSLLILGSEIWRLGAIKVRDGSVKGMTHRHRTSEILRCDFVFLSLYFCISYFGVSNFPCNISEWCQCEGMTHWTRGISWWCWASAVLWYSAGQVLYAGQAQCCAAVLGKCWQICITLELFSQVKSGRRVCPMMYLCITASVHL